MVNCEVLSGNLSDEVLSNIKDATPKLIKLYSFQIEEINIVFGDDIWLLDLNKKYLNHDYYTDIITFDYSEDSLISGDLCISLERVLENAVSLNVSRETEILRVVFHGLLHLCGFNDKTDEDKIAMRKAEDEALNMFSNF